MNSKSTWTEMKGHVSLVFPHLNINKNLKGLAEIKKEIFSLSTSSKLDLQVMKIVLIGSKDFNLSKKDPL